MALTMNEMRGWAWYVSQEPRTIHLNLAVRSWWYRGNEYLVPASIPAASDEHDDAAGPLLPPHIAGTGARPAGLDQGAPKGLER